MKIETLARALAWLCIALIVWLSLVPGTMRPHTGASGHFEHFMAYAGTGFFCALGASRRGPLLWGLALTLLSGALEVAQLEVPGRSGEFGGFFFSSLGAWLGIAAGRLAYALWSRFGAAKVG